MRSRAAAPVQNLPLRETRRGTPERAPQRTACGRSSGAARPMQLGDAPQVRFSWLCVRPHAPCDARLGAAKVRSGALPLHYAQPGALLAPKFSQGSRAARGVCSGSQGLTRVGASCSSLTPRATARAQAG